VPWFINSFLFHFPKRVILPKGLLGEGGFNYSPGMKYCRKEENVEIGKKVYGV